MAIWWLNVANELAALRKAGINQPEAHLPEVFGEPEAAIETTYRVVRLPVAQRPEAAVVPSVIELGPPPAQSRFRPQGHLINTGRGESFLAEGLRRKNRSWS